MNTRRIKDCFWIWGHDAGSHHQPGGPICLPGENKHTPWQGANYLGIKNGCYVVFNGHPAPPFNSKADDLDKFENLVWSIMGDSSSKRNDNNGDDLEEVLKLIDTTPNLVGGILDDFFRPKTKDARFSVQRLKDIRDKLHAASRPLKLWAVYYGELLNIDYSDYLDIIDVVTFWPWNNRDLAVLEPSIEKIIAMTPGKEHLVGCYLYNYGDHCPMTVPQLKTQLDLHEKLLVEGKIQGVIVCSNTVTDIGLDAPEYLRNWLAEHGNTVVPG